MSPKVLPCLLCYDVGGSSLVCCGLGEWGQKCFTEWFLGKHVGMEFLGYNDYTKVVGGGMSLVLFYLRNNQLFDLGMY